VSDVALTDRASADSIVRLAAGGDRQAFAWLVEEHHAPMSRVAYVICGDPEMARDAVQSAWLLAWRRLGTVREPSQVRSWLVAVAANEARQALRRRKHTTVVDLGEIPAPSYGSDPAATISILDLQRVLKKLKPEERTLLALRYVAGLDATELAGHLGGSPSGIRSRLSRLVDRLRHELDVDEEEAP
jgi:RNA polymerase sigma-70 factor (ECF subfamily)